MRGKSAAILLFLLILGCVAAGCGDDDDSTDSGSDDDSPGDDDASTDDDAGDDDATDDDTGDDDTWPPLPDDDADDDTGPAYPESCADGPIFDFQIRQGPFTVPFPNNLYTTPDDSTATGMRVMINENTTRPIGMAASLGWIFDAVNALDGFSTLGSIYVPVHDEVDPATLPDIDDPGAGDGLLLMVADPASPHDGEFARVKAEWIKRSVRLTPWWPLRERTRYLLVATRHLAPAAGGCYQASPSMRDVYFAGEGEVDRGLAARWTDDLARLADLGVAPESVLSIADFTTLDATGGMNAVRAKLDEMAEDDPPELTNWTISPTGDANLDAFATATLSVPIFQNGDGVWEFDGGEPVVDHYEDITVVLSLPSADAHPDGQPWPIMIFAHGAISSKGHVYSDYVGSFYGGNGFAVAGIDAVCHGDRAPDSDFEFAVALCYFDFLSPLRWRDNIRQTISDHLWLSHALRAMESPDEVPLGDDDGDGTPDLDGTTQYYFGHSLGTIHGGIFAALAEDIDAYVMGMAGAKYTTIGLEGPVVEPFRDVIEDLEDEIPSLRVVDTAYVVGALLQNILDAGDPANYLNHVKDDQLDGMEGHDPDVLHMGASDDYTLGGASGGYYARAGGWPQLEPFVWDADTPHATCPHEGSGFYQYDTDEHQLMFVGDALGAASRDQIAHFLRTHLENGIGEIIDPLAN